MSCRIFKKEVFHLKKQPEIAAITKKNIKESFWKLYCNKRIDKITVREIMEKAGYNRGTFYEYYKDVYDVLEQLENDLLPSADRIPSINPSADFNPSAFEFNAFFKFYEENNGYFTVLLGEHGDPSFLSKMKKSVKPILKQGLLVKGVKDDFMLDTLIEYNISAMLGIFNLWFTYENKSTLEEFIEFIFKIRNQGEANIIDDLMKK
jgi:AcrR family transcriptional regulator